jgi:ATP-dependent helicase HepA
MTAKDNVFQTNDHVYWTSRKAAGVVRRCIQSKSEAYYEVSFPHPFGVQVVPGWDLELPLDPLARLARGDFDSALDFQLRIKAARLLYAYSYEGMTCLANSRLELMPHQVFVAHRIISELDPRFLLADEVGLGKTMEAGLVLKELRARGLAKRVLIVVPASLVTQWKGELESKFNENFVVYDSGRAAVLRYDYPTKNIWTIHDNVICSLQFARNKRHHEEIAGARWDLVIFDEAHHLRRYLEHRPTQRYLRQDGKLVIEREPAETRSTQSYRLGEALSDKTDAMLLLTATPLQLSDYEFYSLVELLNPALFPDYESFESYRPLVREINEIATALEDRKLGRLPFAERAQLVDQICHILLGGIKTDSNAQAQVAEFKQKQFPNSLDSAEERQQAIKLLRQAHELSQIMIRNRKRVVMQGQFTARKAWILPVEMTHQERDAYDSVTEYVQTQYARATNIGDRSLGFVMVTFQKLLTSSTRALAKSLRGRRERLEISLLQTKQPTGRMSPDELEELTETFESVREIDELLGVQGRMSAQAVRDEISAINALIVKLEAIKEDSKAVELCKAMDGILKEDPEEKVLIFTQFIETQNYLKDLLAGKGYKVEVFRGGMHREGKDAAVNRFRKTSQVMISTESGGEGRNFQFCHVMFNYDLPWNPMKIEQRIGRLDRIGQKKDVYIYNFAMSGTLEARILQVLHERIRIFEETIGGLDPILGESAERDITTLILEQRNDFDKAVERFEKDLELKVKDAREAEERMADFIMDTSSFRKDTVDELLGRKQTLTNQEIETLTKTFLSRYPNVEFEEISPKVYGIAVPEAFRVDCERRFDRRLGQEGVSYRLRATFDPRVAMDDDSLDFIAFGHPLLDAIIEFCTCLDVHPHFSAQTAHLLIEDDKHIGDQGFLFNFSLDFLGGIRDSRELVPIFVKADLVCDRDLSQMAYKRFGPGSPSRAPSLDLLGKVYLARDVAETELLDILQRKKEAFESTNDGLYQIKLRKLERLYDFQTQKAQKELKETETVLTRLRQSTKPDDQRVVPAWEGRAREAKRQIEEIEGKRREVTGGLEKQKYVACSYQLMNVALVDFCS